LYDIDQCPLSLNKRASKLTRVTFGTLAAAAWIFAAIRLVLSRLSSFAANLRFVVLEINIRERDHARQTKERETDAIPLIYLRSRTMMLAIGCLASAKVRF
jgi:hypothetical protein